MYILKDIESKECRNNFVIDHAPFYSFLSSWERGECNKSQGHTISRQGIYKDDLLIGVILLLHIQAKRGSFRLAPHSPILVGDYFEILGVLLPILKKQAKQAGVAFLRINGVTEHTQENETKYRELGCRSAPIHMHAEETNLLTLIGSEDDMLAGVKKNTRYMITRARREGVIVEHDNSEESIADFIAMHIQHARRKNGKLQYTPFTESYIRELFTQFEGRVHVFNAWYEGEKEATCVTIQFGKTTVYYLGASDIRHPKFSPAYLCQRAAIQYAAEHGSTSYNFWGVSPDENPKHPLHGVSFFKRSFGGEDFFLSHAQDYVYSWKYRITRSIERWRAWKRGYYYPSPTH